MTKLPVNGNYKQNQLKFITKKYEKQNNHPGGDPDHGRQL
jgi:hypothetical protein